MSAIALEASDRGAGGDPQSLSPRALLRRTLVTAGAGVLLRAALFVPLFLWARADATGAAALKGAIGGDVFGWAVLSVLRRPLGRAQLGIGALVEFLLVCVYLQRDTLFEISADAETNAISGLFFFAVLCGKAGIWGARHVLDVTGITETE